MLEMNDLSTAFGDVYNQGLKLHYAEYEDVYI